LRTLAATSVVVACACTASSPPLAHTQASPRALAQAVLDALERRDRAALEALALSEQELRDHVWPDLPVARPERNVPFSYVWTDLRQKSDASLTRLLAARGGQRLTLLDVGFGAEATRYGAYVVHRRTVLRVRNEQGDAEDLQLFGSSLELDGAWKVYSYVTDD
jgi:hypothetical protein